VAMVEGTFTIHSFSVIALIDLESMHSLVNKSRACDLNWDWEELLYVMHVSTPLGKSAVAN
jgi:hypothetical protein